MVHRKITYKRNPLRREAVLFRARTCGSCPVHFFLRTGPWGARPTRLPPAPLLNLLGLFACPKLGRHAFAIRGGMPRHGWLFEMFDSPAPVQFAIEAKNPRTT